MLSALKAAMDLAQSMVGLRGGAALKAQMVELHSQILAAQEAGFTIQKERSALVEKVGELEKEVARLKAWDGEKERYEPKDIYLGALAFVLKPERQGPEPPHWLCAHCYQQTKKSILQPHGRTPEDNRIEIWKCPDRNCGSEIRVAYMIRPGSPKKPE